MNIISIQNNLDIIVEPLKLSAFLKNNSNVINTYSKEKKITGINNHRSDFARRRSCLNIKCKKYGTSGERSFFNYFHINPSVQKKLQYRSKINWFFVI